MVISDGEDELAKAVASIIDQPPNATEPPTQQPQGQQHPQGQSQGQQQPQFLGQQQQPQFQQQVTYAELQHYNMLF